MRSKSDPQNKAIFRIVTIHDPIRQKPAQNSIWRPAVNSTGRLHPDKYISLGHKHLAPGNRVAEKEGFFLGRFQGSWGETVVSKIQSGGRLTVLH
jgi:hypothetical protein